MESIIEKITERILSRVDALLVITKDPDRMDVLLDKALRILEVYARVKGL